MIVEKISGIYKITSPSGRIYIGQSWNILYRKNQYRKGYNKLQRLVHRSLMKYGFDNHLFEIIEVVSQDCTQLQMDALERKHYDIYVELGCRMLNLVQPGQGGKPSEETRKLMSARGKGRLKSEEHKRKIGIAHKGKKLSVEQVELIRKNNTGRKYTHEMRAQLSAKLKGRAKSKSHCENKKIAILQYSKAGDFIKEWKSANDAVCFLGVKDSTSITCCCRNGRQKTAYGYKWKYKNESDKKKMK